MKNREIINLIIIAGVILSGISTFAAREDVLVTAEWLEMNLALDRHDLTVIDVSLQPDGRYISSVDHTATSLDLTSFRDELGRMWPIEEIVPILETAGISNRRTVIIYDNFGGLASSYFFWLLDYLGHPHHYILDGGLDAWEAAGGTMSDMPGASTDRLFDYAVQDSLRVLRTAVDSMVGMADYQLLDGRPAGSYCTVHIPSGTSYPWTESLTDVPGSMPPALWLDDMALADRFTSVDSAETVVAYCQTGLAAAHNYVSLKLLGYPDVRLYEGSFNDWSDRADYPVEICGDPGYTMLDLNQTVFTGGDRFNLKVRLTNPDVARNLDLYVILDAYGFLYFSPSWTMELDWDQIQMPEGHNGYWTLFDFTMPDFSGTAGPFYFYSGAFLPDTFTLVGEIDITSFTLE